MKERGIAQVILMLIIVLGLGTSLYLVQQHTNILPKAATPSQKVDMELITTEENKVAGLDENGNLTEDRAKFIAQVDPEGFEQLVQKGIIKDPDKITTFTIQQNPSIPSLPQATITPPSIDSCGEISSGGDYTLTKDTTSSGRECFHIHDTQNVNIDCQGHAIVANYGQGFAPWAFTIKNVKNFSIKNCSIELQGYPHPKFAYIYRLFEIEDSSLGTIQNNTISLGYISVINSNNIQILNNIVNGIYSQSGSSFNKIRGNKFKISNGAWVGAVVTAAGYGGNNVIENNTIDGGWDGDSANEGAADDGVVLGNETGDIVSGNTVLNNYDCGIETIGKIEDSEITNNKILNSGLCGIGGWYYHSWLNNLIDSNTIDGAAYMIYMFYDVRDHSRRAKDIYFEDNIFSNNKFLNQRSSSYIGPTKQYSSLIDFQNIANDAYDSEFHTANNIFKHNDFGQYLPAPILIPTSMVIDHGGNKCMSINEPTRPLVCSVVIFFKDVDGKHLPSKNNIPQTTSPKVRIELYSTLGHPAVSSSSRSNSSSLVKTAYAESQTTCPGTCADSNGNGPNGLKCTGWIQGDLQKGFKNCKDTGVYAHCYSSCSQSSPSTTTPSPTDNKSCPGGIQSCGGNNRDNLGSCPTGWDYPGNPDWNSWCLNNAGGADAYCYSCGVSDTDKCPGICGNSDRTGLPACATGWEYTPKYNTSCGYQKYCYACAPQNEIPTPQPASPPPINLPPIGTPDQPPPPPTTTSPPGPKYTVSYRFAENRTDLNNASWIPYTQEPEIINRQSGGIYEFLDQTPGSKFIWVEFKANDGSTDIQSDQVELLAD